MTYQTNFNGQRLDKIRFWLISEDGQRSFYPKKDEFVACDHGTHERTVVISHLPEGHYQIRFVVPNYDNFFDTYAPARDIDLKAGEVVKSTRHLSLENRMGTKSLQC